MLKTKKLLALLVTAILLLSCLPLSVASAGTNIVNNLVQYNPSGGNSWNASTREVTITKGWSDHSALRLNPSGVTISLKDLEYITIELEAAISEKIYFFFFSQNGTANNADPSSSYAISTDVIGIEAGQTKADFTITSTPSGATEIKQIKVNGNALTAKIKAITLHYKGEEPDAPKSGTCGDNINWALDDNGVLTLTGSGAMYDYEADKAPWSPYKSVIKNVIVDQGITTLGAYAFYNCASVTEMTFNGATPPTVSARTTFDNMSALTKIYVPEDNYEDYLPALAPYKPVNATITYRTAEATIYTESTRLVTSLGSEFEYKISLAGTYDGYCFDIYAPEGMNILSVSPANTSINADNKNGFWRVSVMPGLEKQESQKELVATVVVAISDTARIGERELSLSNVEIASITDGNGVKSIAYKYATIEVVAFIDGTRGDINGDGEFSYTDVSKLYAYYRGLATVNESVDVDINGDGSFTYTDVSKLYAIYRGLAGFPN